MKEFQKDPMKFLLEAARFFFPNLEAIHKSIFHYFKKRK